MQRNYLVWRSFVDSILSNINKLNGVHHVCIYRDGSDISSSFPDDHRDIESIAQMVEQVFTALQAIDKSHDELYFSVGDKLLAAYLMFDSHIAILLTEKKINFPLIHMGIRSASAKIKRKIALSQATKVVAPVEAEPDKEIEGLDEKPEATEAIRVENAPDTNPELDAIMEKILNELINYFGPAAKFVLEDAVIQWETKYVRSRNNIPELGEILQEELDTAEEKRNFSQFVTKILG